MSGELSNHLWQSTLFALAAGLITVAFRSNRAQVRYWLWLSASVKFLLPFSLLIAVGSLARWAPVTERVGVPSISLRMVQITQPFHEALPLASPAAGATQEWITRAVFAVWLCGLGAIVSMRCLSWLRIRAVLRASTPTALPLAVDVRSAPGLLEPGVVGLLHPVLLLPDGIAERMDPLQFDAVLAHELCHVRRRDNLTSAIHMVVEAVFWFHPLVWWIGARLIEERERACDEAVLQQGNQPHDYAQGILRICQSYVDSPLPCISGVTGANLKIRIRAILQGRVPDGLSFAKKSALVVAGAAAIALPIGVGITGASHVRAQPVFTGTQSASGAVPPFVSVSVQSCEALRHAPLPEVPGSFRSGCTTLQRLMQEAYGTFADGRANPLSTVTITGGPAWTDSELYEIDAKANGQEGQLMMKGPMLQALLEDKFKLKIHRETRAVPVYALTAAASGLRVEPFSGSCVPWDYDHPNPGPEQCATAHPSADGVEMKGWTMADLCYFFLVVLRQPVIDQTGYTGRFDVDFVLPKEAADYLRRGAHGAPSRTDLGDTPSESSLVSSITDGASRMGLRLELTTQPGEFIVIDRAGRPTAN